ncbi:TOMM precursor leader peptide-binding protein [Kineococcus sp. NUM-3379]
MSTPRTPARAPQQHSLRPGLVVSWRPDGSVQLGTSPRSSLRLAGLGPAETAALGELVQRHDVPCALPGTPPPRPRSRAAGGLLSVLRDGGVLSPALDRAAAARPGGPAPADLLPGEAARWAPDAEVWAAAHPAGPDPVLRFTSRRGRRVAVVGGGRTGAGIATTLAACGVGDVLVVDRAPAGPGDVAPVALAEQDTGATRGAAAGQAVRRARPAPVADGTGPGADGAGADLVVLVHSGAADSSAADALLADGTPHLSVVVRDTDVLVGPLVLPGRTPCLRCLDLHRTDGDPGWPHVLTQVLAAAAQRAGGEETATATAAAGLAALQVLAHLDGAPVSSAGTTLELLVPEGVVRARPWPVHPECGCAELPVAAPAG